MCSLIVKANNLTKTGSISVQYNLIFSDERSIIEAQTFTHVQERNYYEIAVTYDNGKVFGHFGHTENFKLYDTEDGKRDSFQRGS